MMINSGSTQDRQDFHDLALGYAQAADRRDYEAFRELFVEDGIVGVHYGDPGSVAPEFEMKGIDLIVKGMRGLEQYSRTMHVVSNQYVDVEGDRATGETYCVAHHIHEKQGVEWVYVMHIRYQDRYTRPSGPWRFSERRLWVEFTTDRPLEHA